MPPQEPLDDVSVEPSRAVPLITGGAALTGAAVDLAPAEDTSARVARPATGSHA